jgi:hypothetical protein
MLLTENSIKAELSDAYLHAVASRAGCAIASADRHTDGTGVYAVVRARERFAADSLYTNFSIDVQLKATSDEPFMDERARYPFPLRLDHYNKLRDPERQPALILVVLYLPSDPSLWLVHSPDGLIARRCANWAGLRGAPESPNRASQAVYVPSENVFSVDGLRTVLKRASRDDLIEHEP